jgi:hypothetical protein
MAMEMIEAVTDIRTESQMMLQSIMRWEFRDASSGAGPSV